MSSWIKCQQIGYTTSVDNILIYLALSRYQYTLMRLLHGCGLLDIQRWQLAISHFTNVAFWFLLLSIGTCRGSVRAAFCSRMSLDAAKSFWEFDHFPSSSFSFSPGVLTDPHCASSLRLYEPFPRSVGDIAPRSTLYLSYLMKLYQSEMCFFFILLSK